MWLDYIFGEKFFVELKRQTENRPYIRWSVLLMPFTLGIYTVAMALWADAHVARTIISAGLFLLFAYWSWGIFKRTRSSKKG